VIAKLLVVTIVVAMLVSLEKLFCFFIKFPDFTNRKKNELKSRKFFGYNQNHEQREKKES
jgi:hypothetical protein